MRNFKTILLTLFTLLSLTACKQPTPEVLYILDIKNSVVCNAEKQTFTITYNIHPELAEVEIDVNATSSAAWVEDIDSSTRGKITITVAENSGDARTATLTIKATKHIDSKVEITQYSKAPEVANHTLMYFFFGTSLSRYFETNIDDTKAAIETGILGNNNRIVFFRQTSTTKGYIAELQMTPNGCQEKRLKDIYLDDKKVITYDFIGTIINDMSEYAPAERYGLVLAGHGLGWVTRDLITSSAQMSVGDGIIANTWIPAPGAEVTRTFGENNVQVNITELAEGIYYSGVELDYILFDACFMSNIESVYELRDLANYIIASPCEIMGRGFPYHRTLPHLFADAGKSSDYRSAAESYHIFYRDEYVGGARCGSVTLYDCHEFDALAEATHAVMPTALDYNQYDINTLQTYEGQSTHLFYDFGEWVNVVGTDSEAVAHFNEQLKKCVIATFTLPTFYSAYGNMGTYYINLDTYSGVTTSAPSKSYPAAWKKTNWYKAAIALEN